MIQVRKMKRLSLSNNVRIKFGALIVLFWSATSASASPTTAFVYPLVGTRISSDYGRRVHPVRRLVKHHDGIDLAAPNSAPIRSIAEGTVIFADKYKGYGNLVVVRHSGEMTSHYGHCQLIKVRPGQKVKAGQILGLVGKTGVVTGPHLHFEVRVNGVSQDPEKFISGLDIPAEG